MKWEDSKEVVTILPFVGGKVLMQLRDFDSRIRHPGTWSYFSGSIKIGEKPEQAVRRELLEEIGYVAGEITELGRLLIAEMNNLVSYTYCCTLDRPLDQLRLNEGVEMTLVSPEEIVGKRIYSQSLKQFFPVAPTTYMHQALSLALAARK